MIMDYSYQTENGSTVFIESMNTEQKEEMKKRYEKYAQMTGKERAENE